MLVEQSAGTKQDMGTSKFTDHEDERPMAEAAKDLGERVAELAQNSGIISKERSLLKLVDNFRDKPNEIAVFEGLSAILKHADHTVEPLVVPLMQNVIDAFGDKSKNIAQGAQTAAEGIIALMRPWAVGVVMPTLLQNGLDKKCKPVPKAMCLKFIGSMAENAPRPMGQQLINVIPVVADLMNDVNKSVSGAAIKCMEKILATSGNKDLDPFIPVVLKAIKDGKQVPEAVEELAGCVFVQNVEAPALAVVTPVLLRGLRERSEVVKRKCCVIIDNMCRLVNEPKEVIPLMDQVEPLLRNQKDGISNPEARAVCEKAHATLTKAGGEGATSYKPMTYSEATKILESALNTTTTPQYKEPLCPNVLRYISKLMACMTNGNCFSNEDWTDSVTLFLNQYFHEETASEVCKRALDMCEVSGKGEEEPWDDDEQGVDMYKGTFSLAYGNLTLLNNTRLHLKRNKFYGLLGPNNCGKTTLMRAIANEQVEGFPKRDQLRTVFVEHEIQEREVGEDKDGYTILNIDLTGIDWVEDTCNKVYNLNPPVTKDRIAEVMEEIGFGNSLKGTGKDRAADANMGITTYSGGWKMKMQLCAATLMNADILMLDEPTGHMDVKNIAWIKGWLSDFVAKGGSVIATSHDTSFLDEMCTHLIDFQDRKLKMFKGIKGSVLQDFVAKFPEKKSYFELRNDVVKFVFPKPGALDGVKSRTKFIMKMTDVTYQYPSRDTPTVFDINLQVSQVSRVAVIGPNGAGKSTAIKLLTGELKPTQGKIYQHPNMRLAYVAQHAFHHLEKHMTKTPVQYIMWRFAGNEDRESLEFRDEAGETEEETTLQEVAWFHDPKNNVLRKCEEKKDFNMRVIPEQILKRRENKKEKTKEYEVKWQYKPIESNTWETRDALVKMGYIKMVQRQDEKEAAAAGLSTKNLTSEDIEKHLKDFGLEAEAASHTLLQALSGGQKVKVVIAASMWQNPHILILDEPTNYLDRDGLGALTKAIEEYLGGVIIISHNREFANAVSQEKWIMEAGRLRAEGESIAKDDNVAEGNIQKEEVLDGAGNKVQVAKAVTVKEAKAELKRIEKQLKDNNKQRNLSDEDVWALEDRQAELKTIIEEDAEKKQVK